MANKKPKEHAKHNLKKSFKVKFFKCEKVGRFAKHCKAKENADKSNELLNMVGTGQVSRNNRWWIDRGATTHMCCEREFFISFQEHNEFIRESCR